MLQILEWVFTWGARNWVVSALTKAPSQPHGPVWAGMQPSLYVPNCAPTGLLSPQRTPFSIAYEASSMGFVTFRSPPKLGWWSRLGAPCTTVLFGQQIQAIVLLSSFHDEGDISFPSWHWYLLSMDSKLRQWSLIIIIIISEKPHLCAHLMRG